MEHSAPQHVRGKPNFFILGAPKCGTTSMAAWLGQHPAIFIPATKEPNFFNTDDNQEPIYGVATLDAYEALFAAAAVAQPAIGEASVFYLSSAVAVANILRYQPNARFIVMLRNPIDMAPALHAEMLILGLENVRDFGTAWDLQYDRRHGRHVPVLSGSWRRLFLYADVCALGTQLQRLFTAVPRDRVLTILLDDAVADPRREYVRALRFLGVDDDFRQEFPVYNSARVIRWPRLTRALFLAIRIKDRLGIRLNLDLWRRVSDRNVVTTSRESLPRAVADMLRCHFAGEVALLSHLLGRDLQHWLAPSARRPHASRRDVTVERQRAAGADAQTSPVARH
jgi:Sulfotransferase domain